MRCLWCVRACCTASTRGGQLCRPSWRCGRDDAPPVGRHQFPGVGVLGTRCHWNQMCRVRIQEVPPGIQSQSKGRGGPTLHPVSDQRLSVGSLEAPTKWPPLRLTTTSLIVTFSWIWADLAQVLASLRHCKISTTAYRVTCRWIPAVKKQPKQNAWDGGL